MTLSLKTIVMVDVERKIAPIIEENSRLRNDVTALKEEIKSLKNWSLQTSQKIDLAATTNDGKIQDLQVKVRNACKNSLTTTTSFAT